MKIFEIILVLSLAISSIFTGLKWKILTWKKKTFVILAIVTATIIALNTTCDYIKENSTDHSHDYLIKNRAHLNCYLYIDSIKEDSLTFHLEIINNNPIPAKNIRYFMEINDISQSENRIFGNELGENDSFNLYSFENFAKPTFVGDNPLAGNLFIYYESIWNNDTLFHKEKITFFVPPEQLSVKKYNPVSKITDKIITMSLLDSIAISNRLKQKDGSVSFAWYNGQIKDSIYYFIPTDSLVLFFRRKHQDIIFQKIFTDGEILTLTKSVIQEKKNHIILLNWFGEHYTLYVDGDSATSISHQRLKEF